MSSALGSPRAYGQHLDLLLDEWQARVALSQPEQQLVSAWQSWPSSMRDRVAKVLARRQASFTAAECLFSDTEQDHLVASAWFVACASEEPRQASGQLDWLQQDPQHTSTAERWQASDPVIAIVQNLQTICFGHGSHVDDALLVRLAMGQLQAAPHTPLQKWIAGLPPEHDTRPLPKTALAEWHYLTALHHQLGDGQVAEVLARSLAQVTANRGKACPLAGDDLYPCLAWSRLLWTALQSLPHDDPRWAPSLRALRLAPCSPALSRHIAKEYWRRLRRPHLKQAYAAQLARWSIWTQGDLLRWQLRGKGRRRSSNAPAWPERHIVSWLDHSQSGRVIAQGQLVEAHALRVLAADGWEGLHAEGSFWHGLCLCLCWSVIWHADGPPARFPAASLPPDWARWGFCSRRQQAIQELLTQLTADPLQVLESSSLLPFLDGQAIAGLGVLPPSETMRAVCSRLPGLAIARIMLRLLQNPRDASGLPDLIVWRDTDCVLWEVKSPGDRLSDQQRAWLAWLVANKINAGVLRIDAKPISQQNLFGQPETIANSPKATTSSPTSPQADTGKRQRRSSRTAQQSLLGIVRATSMQEPKASSPWFDSGLLLGHEACIDGKEATELLAMEGANPASYRLEAVDWFGIASRKAGKRRLFKRRWFRLPTNMRWLCLQRHQAQIDGGVADCLQLILRPSGWLLPRDLCAWEPAVVEADCDLKQPEAWLPPASDPPREHWPGNAHHEAALQELEALLGDTHHARIFDGSQWQLAVPPEAALLWTSPSIVRQDLPFTTQDLINT